MKQLAYCKKYALVFVYFNFAFKGAGDQERRVMNALTKKSSIEETNWKRLVESVVFLKKIIIWSNRVLRLHK